MLRGGGVLGRAFAGPNWVSFYSVNAADCVNYLECLAWLHKG